MRDGRGAGAGGWPGAAALVAALALAALAAHRWGDEAAQPPAGSVGEPVTVRQAPAPGRPAAAAPRAQPARIPPEAAARGTGRRGEWRAGEVEGPGGTPEIRLPSELEPVRPDVVVALTPAETAPAVVPHAHVTDSGHARTPDALGMLGGGTAIQEGAARDGDAVDGPEPGALYWFGPDGLVKVQAPMEAQR
ncbi:MAG TPA: hypothetical protein VGD07_14055 [Methylomirabilota bacterium]|jgi:hypothetical protein